VLILLSYGIGFTDEATSADLNGEAEKQQGLRNRGTFHYTIENKPDPFLPFIKDKDNGGPPDSGSIPEPPVPAVDLTLVGVISVGNRKIAMVEDAAGKGYYLSEGMRIGNRVVKRIRENQVELTDTYRTQSGRIVTKESIMRLRTEGDK
jgi:Tfp pilus assembly protein PilP